MNIVSLFSGAGGLDTGFKNAGFKILWANEFDKSIWKTYQQNHPETYLDTRSIIQVPVSEIPDCDGIIGGPPCQSWSIAGKMKGIQDKRGKLFFEFLRVLANKKPKFFIMENVRGMLLEKNRSSLEGINKSLINCGYKVNLYCIDTSDYRIPQNRKRVFFIGFRNDVKSSFSFPTPSSFAPVVLKDAIWDLKNNALPAKEKNISNSNDCIIPNHEYFTGGYSSIYLSRNRVRSWNEPSFTIQASGRHAPMHPSTPKMKPGIEPSQTVLKSHRRLSVRECARIQTFPDDFIFIYDRLNDGYKMVGNAVPVLLAEVIASEIRSALTQTPIETMKLGFLKSLSQVIKLNNTMTKTA